jgi:hypothetical protein
LFGFNVILILGQMVLVPGTVPDTRYLILRSC